MINLHERMLPTLAGVKPAIFWSPVGHSSNSATEAGSTTVKHILELDNGTFVMYELLLQPLSNNILSTDTLYTRFEVN